MGGGAIAGAFQCYQTDAEVAILLWAIVGTAMSSIARGRRA